MIIAEEKNTLNEILNLDNFGAAFGDRIILSDVNLRVYDHGVFILMGPSGTGKSTLLRSLAGLNDANPTFRIWGSASYQGESLSEYNRPVLVAQSAKLMMKSVLENIVSNLPERETLTQGQQQELVIRLLEYAGLDELKDSLQENVVNLPIALQRHLAILRMAAAGPRLLCIDEPTAGLNEESSQRMLEYIAKESRRRSILIVLHNQNQARYLGGFTGLLAGGQIMEVQQTEHFFNQPQSKPARQFVKLGSCNVPAPDANPDELDHDVPPPPPLPEAARVVPSESYGPRGFLWLKRGQLAGTPLPGVFHDIEYDMKALKRVGVSCLVSLTTKPVDKNILQEYEVAGLWFPIKDMGAPTINEAIEICQAIDSSISNGDVVAVHCRAGLGRTGTVLAAYLIWEGLDALEALDKVRGVEPRWVQSEVQVKFLENFATEIATKHTGDAH